MKKTVLILCFLFMSFFTVYGQNTQLNDYTWYVHSIETNGNTVEKPETPEMTIQTEFDLVANTLSSEMCCAGNFQFDISVNGGTSSFAGFNFFENPTSCDTTENNTFSNLFKAFFQNNLNQDFSYSIISENNYESKLEIENVNGETATFYNSPHLDRQSVLFDEISGNEWHLNYMSVDGSNYSFTDTNQEFGEITAQFNYDGSFQTTVCGQLTGSFTLGDEYSVSENFYFNCGDISGGSTNCGNTENSETQDAYFSVFTIHSQEIIDIQFDIIDGQNEPCFLEVFTIETSDGDFLTFSNCSNLSVKNTQQQRIKVYPNPARKYVFLETPKAQTIDELTIMDVTGKVVKRYFDIQEKIDVSTFNSGLYFLRITTGNKSFIKKTIKQ
jgi:hypothetical protein